MFVPDMPTRSRSYDGAGDTVGVQMVPGVREFSALAGGADDVLRPPEQHGDLRDLEGSGAVLEHLWNTTVVDRWGRLARWCVHNRFVPGMISTVWGRLVRSRHRW